MVVRLSRYVVAAIVLVGCKPAADDPRCVPGTSASCACPSGSRGAQTCLPSGTFAACTCTPPAAQNVPPRPSSSAQGATSPASTVDLHRVDWNNRRFRLDGEWIQLTNATARPDRYSLVEVAGTQFGDLTGDATEEVVVEIVRTHYADLPENVGSTEGLDSTREFRVYAARPGEPEPHYIGHATVPDAEIRVLSFAVVGRRLVLTGDPNFGHARAEYEVRGDKVVEIRP